MSDFNAILAPGMRVRHPEQTDWGIGEVQSNVGGKLTVNFPETGKVVFNSAQVTLDLVFDDE